MAIFKSYEYWNVLDIKYPQKNNQLHSAELEAGLLHSQTLYEKSIIAKVTVIASDFLVFIMMHTQNNESQEYSLKKYLIIMKEYAKNVIDIIYSKLLGFHIEIEYNTALYSIRFLKPGEEHTEKKTLDATFELERYFEGKLIKFSTDLDISHLSTFEQKVLGETKKIKYGRTISYSRLAEKIGCGGARAVGNALGNNPIPIIIPCHRVVAKKGLGGYSAGINIKTKLLEFEKRNINNI